MDVLQTLDHPNLVKVFGCIENSTDFFVILELCEGGSVFDVLSNRKMINERLAAEMVIQMLDASDFLHSLGIANRKITPEKYIFSKTPIASVLKMNPCTCACLKKDCLLPRGVNGGGMDGGGMDEGVVDVGGNDGMWAERNDFIAPEGQKGPASDVWSLGVILFILLSGTIPTIDSKKVSAVMEGRKNGRWTFQHDRWENSSSLAKQLLRRMLEVDPKKRIESHEALCKARDWLNELSESTIPEKEVDICSNIREYMNTRTPATSYWLFD
eukprot:GHVL01002410.1.p1 GENE.GHVL01002410.1~~GHVL01002410.1.p1  ORF type:complete len:270 (-),score=61.72 GHVL01002410.1:621-1430(-)